MSQDHQPGKFEDRFILPKEKFSKSLMLRHAFPRSHAPIAVHFGVWQSIFYTTLKFLAPSAKYVGFRAIFILESLERVDIFDSDIGGYLNILRRCPEEPYSQFYLPGRFGLANPRLSPSFCWGWTSSCNLSPEISSGEDASICMSHR